MELEATMAMECHGCRCTFLGGLELLKEYIVENIGMQWDSYGKLGDFMGCVEIYGSFIENHAE